MAIKIVEIENTDERLICTGLIIDDVVIGQLAPILDLNIFTSEYTKLVAKWCLSFFNQFKKAPLAHIQDIFESERRNVLDEDTAELIEIFLSNLNEQYFADAEMPIYNNAYMLEEAEKYIKKRKALMLCDDIKANISHNNILEAEGLIAQYSIPQRPQAAADDVFTEDFWIETEQESDILFNFSGAVNKIVGPIERGNFISFLAPEKRGKSWWLIYSALRAYQQRCNVAFFSIGDMTKNDIKRRFRHILTGKDPKRVHAYSADCPIVDCYYNQIGQCPLGEETDALPLDNARNKKTHISMFEDFPEHQVCTKCQRDSVLSQYFVGRPWWKKQEVSPVDLHQTRKRMLFKSGNKSFKLFVHRARTVNISQIRTELQITHQQTGFMPDVVCVDYMDLLSAEPGTQKEVSRDRTNENWLAARALSQEFNVAFISATQATQNTRTTAQVEQTDIAEDKRKLAHVTGMLALNQTPDEKKNGIIRISNIAMRDSDFNVTANAVVLQNLAMGKVCLSSYLEKNPKNKGKKQNDTFKKSTGEWNGF